MQLTGPAITRERERPALLPTRLPDAEPSPTDVFLSSLGIESEVERLGQETGLTRNDLAVLYGSSSPDFHPELTKALNAYAGLRDAFFEHQENAQAYLEYRNCLLTIMYLDQAPHAIDQIQQLEKTLGDRPVLTDIPSPAAKDLRRAVMYELYTDLFTKDEDGVAGTFVTLQEKLPYLEELGVTHLWILPPFDSPGLDAGFDIRDKRKIADQLGGNEAFISFVQAAADRGMTVMVDMVVNHLSYQSEEFQAAINPEHKKHNTYKDWFIFHEGTRDTPPEDLPAWLIFGDMIMPLAGKEHFPDVAGVAKAANWTWVEPIGKWVYNRFMPQMPDVNYDNPAVLANELSVIDHWIGATQTPMMFRFDALKLAIKRDRHAINQVHGATHQALGELIESYRGENLPQAHMFLRLLRAFTQHRYSGRVQIVSEVWDSPEQVKRYTGPAGEGAHQFGFDLMSRLMETFYQKDARRLYEAITRDESIPSGITYLGLLRHHDGASTQVATERDMEAAIAALPELAIPADILNSIQQYYPEFTKTSVFEETGISARLRLLFEAIERTDDPAIIIPSLQQAFALLFFVARTPMIYMGDEFGQTNDYDHLLARSVGDGVDLPGIDLRHAHRAMRPFSEIAQLLRDPKSLEAQIFTSLQQFISLRRSEWSGPLWHGTLHPIGAVDASSGEEVHHVFATYRKASDEKTPGVLMLANLSNEPIVIRLAGIRLDAPAEKLMDMLSGDDMEVELQGGEPIFRLGPKATVWLTSM